MTNLNQIEILNYYRQTSRLQLFFDILRLGDHISQGLGWFRSSNEFVLQQFRGRGTLFRILDQTPVNINVSNVLYRKCHISDRFSNTVKPEVTKPSKSNPLFTKNTVVESHFQLFNVRVPLYNDHLSTKSTILKSLLTGVAVSYSPVVNVSNQKFIKITWRQTR